MKYDQCKYRAPRKVNEEAQAHGQGLEWQWRPPVGSRRDATCWNKSHQLVLQGARLLKELSTCKPDTHMYRINNQ